MFHWILAGVLLLNFTSCSTRPRRATAAPTIRVMTYNIHHGEGLDGKVDLGRIAQLIKDQRADLVALQEVDKGTERTQRRDFPAELALLTGMTCVFSNNYDYQGGEYGNAVLTRFPIKHWTNLHLENIGKAESRGVLQLTLDVRGRELVFLNTHFDQHPNDAARWNGVAEIEDLIHRVYHGKTLLLCGDFNDTPNSRVCRRLNESWDDTWKQIGSGEGLTSSTSRPSRRIDYIWTSKTGTLLPVRVWVPNSDASDHLPVVAEFQLQ